MRSGIAAPVGILVRTVITTYKSSFLLDKVISAHTDMTLLFSANVPFTHTVGTGYRNEGGSSMAAPVDIMVDSQ